MTQPRNPALRPVYPRAAGSLLVLPLLFAACGVASSPEPTASLGPVSPSAGASTGAAVFTSETFSVPLALTLIGGWVVEGDHASDIDLQRGAQDAGISSITSATVASTGPDIPWPDDLFAWLDSRPEFTPSAPRQVTIGGRPATLIDADATVPAGTRIEMICAEPRHSCWLVDAPQSWRFIEVRNADGSGIVVITNSALGGLADYASALDDLLATLEFR